MNIDNALTQWLLEPDNPAVHYRTQTEILNKAAGKQPVIDWLNEKLPAGWREQNGLWRTYYLTAIAECGLSIDDMRLDKDAALLLHGGNGAVDNGCGDFMHLRALIRLGLGNEPLVKDALSSIPKRQLPDGGFLCLHRLDKLKYTPKSCVKANMHALMLCAEGRKKGVELAFADGLLSYFWNHNIFYRTDHPDTLILPAREGWRTVDTFFPFEVMRVGLQNMVEALCALGFGNDPRLDEAWNLLENQRDESGKYLLKGTLTKAYLPKERIGKPSKWVTFYALLAKKESEQA